VFNRVLFNALSVPQGGMPGGGGLLPAAGPMYQQQGQQGQPGQMQIEQPGFVGAQQQQQPRGPVSTGGASSARAESSSRADAENEAPDGTWAATIYRPVKVRSRTPTR
jgi:hypothetical protein